MTNYLHEAETKLASKGKLRAVIKDIEGCFPNMDKDAIHVRTWMDYVDGT